MKECRTTRHSGHTPAVAASSPLSADAVGLDEHDEPLREMCIDYRGAHPVHAENYFQRIVRWVKQQMVRQSFAPSSVRQTSPVFCRKCYFCGKKQGARVAPCDGCDCALSSPSSATGFAWVSVNDRLPEEGIHVQLLHRDGSQWVGYKDIERPTWEETFTAYPYFIDRAEREIWEWGDITHWHPLEVPILSATDSGNAGKEKP